MLTHEFLTRRVRALQEFFIGQYGRFWQQIVKSRLKLTAAPLYINKAGVLPSLATMKLCEQLAVSLGFRPVDHVKASLFERKKSRQVESLAAQVSSAIIALQMPTYKLLCKVLSHKTRRRHLFSDVLPLDTVRLTQGEQGTPSPVLQAPSPAELVLRALDEVPPGCDPHPKGGLATPTLSLSGSRAVLKTPREDSSARSS